MDRIINVKVSGHHLSKDNNNAGARGEANVTLLRITFDESWSYFAKTITFWDARGANPVNRTLTTDIIENIADGPNVYIVPIPQEPLAVAGKLTFVIDGFVDSKRQRSVCDELVVEDSPVTASNPIDPTPTQAEQLQTQIDDIIGTIQDAVLAEVNANAASRAAENSANNASDSASIAIQVLEAVKGYAEDAEVHSNKAQNAANTAPYIGDNGNWFSWDKDTESFYDTGVLAQADSQAYIDKTISEMRSELNLGLTYYGDAGIIPSPVEWFTYTINENDSTAEIIITGLSDTWTNLEDDSKNNIFIPYEINGCKITTIGLCAFEITGLTSINIPNSVTTIVDYAFYSCTNLTSINIPDSVTRIAEGAFDNCHEDLTIICSQGSYAKTYAKENGIKYAYDVIEVDNALNDTSENPVQNKVINAAIQQLEENKADTSHTHDFGAKIEGTKYIEEIKWELGVITSDNGTNGDNPQRARTADYLEYDDSVVITMSGDAQIIALFYNDEKGYIGYSGKEWLTGTINVKDIAPEGAKYFRLSARWANKEGSNGTTITENNISDISDNVEVQRDFVQTLTDLILDDVNKKLDEELASKIDESRITKEAEDIDETWSINISGSAEKANEADKAINDEYGNRIAETYIYDVTRLPGDEVNIMFFSPGFAGGPVISAPSQKYVDDAVNDRRNYPYSVIDMASVTESISLIPNNVIYAFGNFADNGTGLVVNITSGNTVGYTEESVLILDFSSVETAPTVTFNTASGTIKWINGEPPSVEAGKTYMFSFTHAKDADNNIVSLLAVGGEFA